MQGENERRLVSQTLQYRWIRISLALAVFGAFSASGRCAESGPPVLRKLDNAAPLEGFRAETYAGEARAEAMLVVPSDQVIIGFLTQTLLPSDAAVLKTKLAALYVPGKQRRNLTFRTLDEGGIVQFGPFTSRAQFNKAVQALIAKIPREPAGVPASSAEICGLLEKLSPADASPWASMPACRPLARTGPPHRSLPGSVSGADVPQPAAANHLLVAGRRSLHCFGIGFAGNRSPGCAPGSRGDPDRTDFRGRNLC
jgi:hypothetical protein